MADAYTPPFRRRVEAAFASGVRAQLDSQGVTSNQLAIFEGGGDDFEDKGFFLVVACLHVNEVAPQSGAYHADIRLSLCSQVNLKTSAEHDVLHKAVQLALRSMPRNAIGNGVQFTGWEIDREESAIEEQTHGDVFFIEGGALDLNVLNGP